MTNLSRRKFFGFMAAAPVALPLAVEAACVPQGLPFTAGNFPPLATTATTTISATALPSHTHSLISNGFGWHREAANKFTFRDGGTVI